MGVSSLFRYCVEYLHLSENETYRFTQVTRKSVEVPALKEAVAEGKLTVSQASRIAPVITQENSEDWISKAASFTQKDLEREISKEKPKPVTLERVRVLTPERSELRLTISKELEADLLRAQEVLRAQSLEETLQMAIEFTLMHRDPVKKAERAKASRKSPTLRQVFVGSGRRHSLRRAGRGHATVPVEQITMAKVAHKLQTRSPIPADIKHQVNLRDRGRCTFRGCGESRWVDLHHVEKISFGGKHTLDNIARLCVSNNP